MEGSEEGKRRKEGRELSKREDGWKEGKDQKKGKVKERKG